MSVTSFVKSSSKTVFDAPGLKWTSMMPRFGGRSTPSFG